MELILKESNITSYNDISDYYKAFINYLDTTPKTISSYERNLKVFANWLKDNNIINPTREDIINFRNEINATHKPTTTRAYINTVKQFFKWLSYEGLYKNIADNVKGAKIERLHKKDALTINQVKDLLASIDQSTEEGLRNYAIILLCVCCGLRTIEVVRADIKDLRNKGDFIALYIQGKGKQDKSDFVKIPHGVEQALRNYLKARGTTEENAPLFASCSDRNKEERLSTRTISRIVKNQLRTIGLNSEFLTAHSLRHTTANINLRNGGSLEDTKQLLRHADISTTLIYIKEIDKAESKSEQRIADLIL